MRDVPISAYLTGILIQYIYPYEITIYETPLNNICNRNNIYG